MSPIIVIDSPEKFPFHRFTIEYRPQSNDQAIYRISHNHLNIQLIMDFTNTMKEDQLPFFVKTLTKNGSEGLVRYGSEGPAPRQDADTQLTFQRV
jgi:hypothetical protein